MNIVNSEIIVPRALELTSEYFEDFLQSRNIDYLRWAIVDCNEEYYILNVSHKIEK